MANEKSKLSRYLWIVNGFIVLIICLFILYNIIENINFRDRDIHGGVIVGEEKEKAKEKNLELQTIRYSIYWTPKTRPAYKVDYLTKRGVL